MGILETAQYIWQGPQWLRQKSLVKVKQVRQRWMKKTTTVGSRNLSRQNTNQPTNGEREKARRHCRDWHWRLVPPMAGRAAISCPRWAPVSVVFLLKKHIRSCPDDTSTDPEWVVLCTCHWVHSDSWQPCDEWVTLCPVLRSPAQLLDTQRVASVMEAIHLLLGLSLSLSLSIFSSTVFSKEPWLLLCMNSLCVF